MPTELKIPSVGESITEAQISKWLKREGDHVEKDEPVAELETDKVTVELPAPESGRISELLKQEGETAEVGEVIGYLEAGDGAPAKGESKKKQEQESGGGKEDEDAKPKRAAEGKQSGKQKKDEKDRGKGDRDDGSQRKAKQRDEKPSQVEVEPRIMPAAQRALAEHGLRAADVKATGPGGRLLKEDVLRHVESRPSDSPPSSEGPGEGEKPSRTKEKAFPDREEETVPMSPIRKRIAQRLVDAQKNAALLTTFNEIDMSAVISLRERFKQTFQDRYGVKLGFMSFFVKAAIDALSHYPAINAEVRDESIVYRNYYDIGIAVSTERGLLVPIVRDAHHQSFAEIEKTINDFADRARQNKIRIEELQGGTFTITNGGVFGSLLSTPIVSPPQSGVLGMHTIQQRPVAVEGEVVIRPMMYVALTYDHRIVDGREAVGFLKRVKEAVEDPARMLLEV